MSIIILSLKDTGSQIPKRKPVLTSVIKSTSDDTVSVRILTVKTKHELHQTKMGWVAH